MSKFKVKSRYGQIRGFEFVKSDNNKYIWQLDMPDKNGFYRFAKDAETNKITMIDFDGGPYLDIGTMLAADENAIYTISDIEIVNSLNKILITTNRRVINPIFRIP